MQVHQIHQVGQPYLEGKTRWAEGAEYTYSWMGHELHLFLARPTRQEIAAVSTGIAEFALVVEQSVVFLLYHFVPGIPWGGAPYAWCQVAENEQPYGPPPETPNNPSTIQVHLIDAANGVLCAVRTVAISASFHKVLEATLRNHILRAWDESSYKERLNEIHSCYLGPEFMLPHAIARYRSGDREV